MRPLVLLVIGGVSATIFHGSPPRHVAPGIQPIATLRVARSAHTATLLPSGHILVVGGMGPGGAMASVELFDPRTNTVRDMPPLVEPRAAHTATLLESGEVLIAGGFNGAYLNSVEIMDPVTQEWEKHDVLRQGRSGHTATPLPNGSILFIGGVGDGWTFLRTAESYEPATMSSKRVGDLSVPRESHTATLLEDGTVLVVGGHSGRRERMEVYAHAERFIPLEGRFQPAGRLATARHKHDAVRLLDGRVLVVGGADRTDRTWYETTEIYDQGTGTFAPGPRMENARYKIAGTTVVLPNGDALVTSGAASAEILSFNEPRFQRVPGRYPEPYRFAAAVRLADGDVVILGGYADGNRNTAGIWRYSRD